MPALKRKNIQISEKLTTKIMIDAYAYNGWIFLYLIISLFVLI